MLLELSDLPYAHDALSPYMSAETLELHHDKHHFAYVTNGNALIEANGVAGISIENIMIDSFDNGAGGPLFNNVAQHWNCLLYTSPSPRDRQKCRMPSSA